MADVSIDVPDGDRFQEADRGQMLLLAGLLVAVALVVLIVLLNTTIYSENVATRGVEAADGEALEVRATAVEGVGELIDATNRAGHGTHGDARDAVAAGIADLDERATRRYARRGGVTHLESRSGAMTEGWYLATDGNETSLANATNATEYTFASDVERTRGFSVAVADVTSLAETDAGNATDEAFGVTFDDADPNASVLPESHEVYLYRPDGGSDDVAVAVGSDGNDPTVVCRVTVTGDETVTLELTADRLVVRDDGGRTVDTANCFGVWHEDLFSPGDAYHVGFVNAAAAVGEATATVRTSVDDTYQNTGYATPGVYDATIDIRYRTAELGFETTVRVAPGEPDA